VGGESEFAELLRARRYASGLTQEELARKAGVGVRTLRDLETGRAATPHRATVDLLANALELAGPDRDEFITSARSARALGPDDLVTVALPPAPELIGRDGDLRDVTALLEVAGLVTLVGLAGVGKTALALAVGERAADRFPGGVGGVAITDRSTDTDELAAAAAVFGASRAERLPARLANRGPALLIVDGADRAGEAARAMVSWLRSRIPRLRLLVTSRHPLQLPGEHHWPVAPLEVPPLGAGDVTSYAAVALFLDRLRRVRQHPVLAEEVPIVGELARRLGGLPLALELVAARGRVLELAEILDRYGDRVLDLGTGEPPGSTLRDAVAASCRLLDAGEWACLQWLAVFCARWSLELAEDLLAPRSAGRDVVGLVDRLVGLGLVSLRPGGHGLRFRLADVVREYVFEQHPADLEEARNRHADVMARLVARTREDFAGSGRGALVTGWDYLTADLRTALDHASAVDPHTALRIAAALPRWWRMRGREAEGLATLTRLLADPRTADAEPSLRAEANRGITYLTAS
jgi:predicted ATPase/DNA-binding XRE family transcriptional regulator